MPKFRPEYSGAKNAWGLFSAGVVFDVVIILPVIIFIWLMVKTTLQVESGGGRAARSVTSTRLLQAVLVLFAASTCILISLTAANNSNSRVFKALIGSLSFTTFLPQILLTGALLANFKFRQANAGIIDSSCRFTVLYLVNASMAMISTVGLISKLFPYRDAVSWFTGGLVLAFLGYPPLFWRFVTHDTSVERFKSAGFANAEGVRSTRNWILGFNFFIYFVVAFGVCLEMSGNLGKDEEKKWRTVGNQQPFPTLMILVPFLSVVLTNTLVLNEIKAVIYPVGSNSSDNLEHGTPVTVSEGGTPLATEESPPAAGAGQLYTDPLLTVELVHAHHCALTPVVVIMVFTAIISVINQATQIIAFAASSENQQRPWLVPPPPEDMKWPFAWSIAFYFIGCFIAIFQLALAIRVHSVVSSRVSVTDKAMLPAAAQRVLAEKDEKGEVLGPVARVRLLLATKQFNQVLTLFMFFVNFITFSSDFGHAITPLPGEWVELSVVQGQILTIIQIVCSFIGMVVAAVTISSPFHKMPYDSSGRLTTILKGAVFFYGIMSTALFSCTSVGGWAIFVSLGNFLVLVGTALASVKRLFLEPQWLLATGIKHPKRYILSFLGLQLVVACCALSLFFLIKVDKHGSACLNGSDQRDKNDDDDNDNEDKMKKGGSLIQNITFALSVGSLLVQCNYLINEVKAFLNTVSARAELTSPTSALSTATAKIKVAPGSPSHASTASAISTIVVVVAINTFGIACGQQVDQAIAIFFFLALAVTVFHFSSPIQMSSVGMGHHAATSTPASPRSAPLQKRGGEEAAARSPEAEADSHHAPPTGKLKQLAVPKASLTPPPATPAAAAAPAATTKPSKATQPTQDEPTGAPPTAGATSPPVTNAAGGGGGGVKRLAAAFNHE